jgi:hypothetical protein
VLDDETYRTVRVMMMMIHNDRSFSLFLVVIVVTAATLTSAFVAVVGPPSSSHSSSTTRSVSSWVVLPASRYDYDRMYSPRNDVYYRPDTDDAMTQNRRQATSMQGQDYRPPTAMPRRTSSSIFNPRNDVFARQPEADSVDLMVEKELAKILTKSRYAIENELYNIHQIQIARDVHSREELACLLLKARLSGGNGGGNNNGSMNGNDNGRSIRTTNNNQQQQQPPSYYSSTTNAGLPDDDEPTFAPPRTTTSNNNRRRTNNQQLLSSYLSTNTGMPEPLLNGSSL